MLSAFITGLAGPELLAREAAVLREARPCGVILFARNAVDPDQLCRLTDAASAMIGEEILSPHRSGGRTRTALEAAHWRALPAAAAYAVGYGGDLQRAARAARAAAG
jgi:beta-N-acetylhexosaminidase